MSENFTIRTQTYNETNKQQEHMYVNSISL